MSLTITKTGLQDTIQDLGRYGYQHLGINPGGVMDKFSATIANLLVGNNSQEAVIEINFPAGHFLFKEPALIALAGAGLGARIGEKDIPFHQPVLVGKGATLQFTRLHKGARVYLAIQQGVLLTPWLGSNSTHLKAGAGGYKGRTLQKGDELSYTPAKTPSWFNEGTCKALPWRAGIDWGDTTQEIFILPGNEWINLSNDSKKELTANPFIITNQADRMGYLLSGAALAIEQGYELLSSGVSYGTLQVLPSGQLMLLMADHQATGGYPRAAHVISAHHSKLAQLRPGDEIRFQWTDISAAENLFIKQQLHLLQLQNACTFSLQDWIHANC